MYQFLLVIVSSYVLLSVSKLILTSQLTKYRNKEAELEKSKLFHLAAVGLLIGYGMFWINLTLLLAYIIKIYFL